MKSYVESSYPGRGSMTGGGGQRASYTTGPVLGRAAGSGRKPAAFCTSCEAKLNQDEMLVSNQTEGRCLACQELVEAQSACRVCHLPWTSSNPANVVPCDSCGFYMHGNCVKKGALETKSRGRFYTYCPHCSLALPPPPPSSAYAAVGRDMGSGGVSARGGVASDRIRQNGAPLPLSLLGVAAGSVLGPRSPLGAFGGRGRGGSSLTAPLAPPMPPPVAALQQIAASLQGQLRMLQTQQQALLRQYEQQLRTVTPAPAPPTAYSLFQLDMFRVYQEEGFEFDPQELHPVINNAWLQLTPDERAGYDSRAGHEGAVHAANAQLYVQLYYEYEALAGHVGTVPDTSLLPKTLQSVLQNVRQLARLCGGVEGSVQGPGPGSGRGPGRPPGSTAAAAAAAAVGRGGGGGSALAAGYSTGGGRGVKRSAMDTLAGATMLMGMNMGAGGRVMAPPPPPPPPPDDDDDDDDEDYEVEGTAAAPPPPQHSSDQPAQLQSSKRARRATSPSVAAALQPSRPPPRNTRLPVDKLPTGITDLPAQLSVSCNDVSGTFVVDGIKVLCHCKDCKDLQRAQPEFHPTHWEQHCGAGTAKKWKASIKIEPGGAPEVTPGGNPMQIGKWFDMLGVEFRPAKTTGGPPVLEFTGATIRRLEAEGVAAAGGGVGADGGAGSGSGSGSGDAALALLPSSSPLPSSQMTPLPSSPRQQEQPEQQQPLLPNSKEQQDQEMQQPMSSLPPRSCTRAAQASLHQLRSSVPPPGNPGAGSGSGRRGGGDDGTVGSGNLTPTGGGGTAKPPRPVSDGDGDGDTVFCIQEDCTALDMQPGSGGVGEAGESSSRGSASDILGPNTTA